jgi:L-lactate dehydrogenase complex protein LldG
VRRARASLAAPSLADDARWPALGAPAAGLAAQFARACEAAGGRCLRVAGAAGAAAAIAERPAPARAFSALPEILRAPLGAEERSDPRRLEGLELAVLPGVFGVAESGAVWVDAGSLPERAALWLAEHLVLVVPAGELVPQLDAAYARLRFRGPGFGVFVAGPSKTADIEQALVIGAQGPRRTTVLLVDGWSAGAQTNSGIGV